MAQAETLDGILVIGGGLAGAAAATRLALAGRKVMLWERERLAHHKVCGEFLSPDGLVHLAALGVDVDALGAVPIEALRLVGRGRVRTARLGFTARSLTRHRLDAALLARAEDAGVDVHRGVAARGLGPEGMAFSAHGDVQARALVLATGKHNLRGHRRDGAGTIDHLVGFKTYWRLSPEQRAALAGHSEIILFEGGYAGLQLVERDAANLCFLVNPRRHAEAHGNFEALVAGLAAEVPHLARRLEAAVPLLDRPIAISGVPYGYLLRADAPETVPANLLPVGDQAAVIPSFTGMGMSLALHGAALAARALLAGDGTAAYARALARDVGPPVSRATLLQTWVGEQARGQARVVALAGVIPGLLRAGTALTRLRSGVAAKAAAIP